MDDYEKAVEHYNLGITYSKQGRLEEAILEYKRAINYKPDFAEAHYDLGVDYFQLNMIDDAIREYALTIRFKPDYIKAHENLLQAISM
ncbi:MAG: tetratricopeptide repeat protein, partial [Alphaproteobacteria bacterium]|nr:tetratricopeptide repeat protein [Alphaproteobacteria bacterium]